MFGFIFIFFFIYIWIGANQVYGECSEAQNFAIESCYHSTMFKDYNIKDNEDLKNIFKQLFAKTESLNAACNAKKSLDTCINDSTARLKCFNLLNFVNITSGEETRNPIAENDIDPMALLANYLQLDYLCGNNNTHIYDIATQNHDQIISAIVGCQNDHPLASCGFANLMIDCVVKNVTENCGPSAGCFAKKFLSIDICASDDFSEGCGICNKLSTNPNPIDSLCTDDVNGSSSQKSYIINLSLMFTVFVVYVLS